MKVVAWNVRHNPLTLAREGVDDADIYLLSEAPPGIGTPRLNIESEERTIGLDCPHVEGRCTCNRHWSAAVASPHGLERIRDARRSRSGRVLRFEASRKGSWVAARVFLPEDGEEVTAISLYGLLDEKSDASVHRSLSELSPIFEDERYGRLLLMGGDLNTLARAGLGSRRLAKDEGVLNRITEGFGLVDLLKRTIRGSARGPLERCGCGYGTACEHTWTHVHGDDPTTKFQDDYLFASAALADRLGACEVLPFTEASDHAPLVVRSRIDA